MKRQWILEISDGYDTPNRAKVFDKAEDLNAALEGINFSFSDEIGIDGWESILKVYSMPFNGSLKQNKWIDVVW